MTPTDKQGISQSTACEQLSHLIYFYWWFIFTFGKSIWLRRKKLVFCSMWICDSEWQIYMYVYIYMRTLSYVLYNSFTCLVYMLVLKLPCPAASLIHCIYGWGRMPVADVVVSTRKQPTVYAFEMIIYFIYSVPVSHRSLLWNITEMKHSYNSILKWHSLILHCRACCALRLLKSNHVEKNSVWVQNGSTNQEH